MKILRNGLTQRWVGASLFAVALVLCEPIYALAFDVGSATGEKPKSGRMLLIVGAPGEESYQEEFARWAQSWKAVAPTQHLELTTIGLGSTGAVADRDTIHQQIDSAIQADTPSLWIVMIGHGTFDRGVTKFNLRGADITVQEMATWLKPWRNRLIVLCCSSASSSFLTELSGPERVIVTATRSGNEQNYARFGGYLAQAITDTATDLDHDDEVSLLEAYLAAASQTDKFYQEASRLATEHALLDDNGDKLGTGASFFRGLRPAKSPEPGKSMDGAVAARIMLRASTTGPKFTGEQLVQREQIEESIHVLRGRKSTMNADDYYSQLEALLLQLAALYQTAESAIEKQGK